ncbi:Wadjet anti-phage system protein JetD domain-containing protein [Rhodococcus sp. HNM0563]|uniref:Wadjet anti-phage system protein JetD domain-containing protein n=1 Tax=Rhodococcus sp. HNM0563 TaxID=2716339 RepID=UPI003216C1EE
MKAVSSAAVGDKARTAYRSRRSRWISDPDAASVDTVTVALHPPSETAVAADPDAAVSWVRSWHSYAGCGSVSWETRRWRSFGTQDVPVRITLSGAAEIAAAAGRAAEWRTLIARRQRLIDELGPGTAGLSAAVASTHTRWLGLDDEDFARLVGVVGWLAAHPRSGLLVRQLPIPGVDTKWVSRHRGTVEALLEGVRGDRDLGVRALPRMCEVAVCDRLLLPSAPRIFATSIDELSSLPVNPSTTLVLENKEGLHALPHLPSAVAVHGGGYSVHELATVPWLAASDVVYWGDLDTHGFAILDRFRQHLPHVRSLLMDVDTATQWRDLTVPEPTPAGHVPEHLTTTERAAFEFVRDGRLRLEQERIPWPYVVEHLSAI